MDLAIGHLRQAWARSRAYRIILIVTLVYTVLRLEVAVDYEH
jgi:hypothetical protein